jgi:hypothetical protein
MKIKKEGFSSFIKLDKEYFKVNQIRRIRFVFGEITNDDTGKKTKYAKALIYWKNIEIPTKVKGTPGQILKFKDQWKICIALL